MPQSTCVPRNFVDASFSETQNACGVLVSLHSEAKRDEAGTSIANHFRKCQVYLGLYKFDKV